MIGHVCSQTLAKYDFVIGGLVPGAWLVFHFDIVKSLISIFAIYFFDSSVNAVVMMIVYSTNCVVNIYFRYPWLDYVIPQFTTNVFCL